MHEILWQHVSPCQYSALTLKIVYGVSWLSFILSYFTRYTFFVASTIDIFQDLKFIYQWFGFGIYTMFGVTSTVCSCWVMTWIMSSSFKINYKNLSLKWTSSLLSFIYNLMSNNLQNVIFSQMFRNISWTKKLFTSILFLCISNVLAQCHLTYTA